MASNRINSKQKLDKQATGASSWLMMNNKQSKDHPLFLFDFDLQV
jgi:hypothetical protein